MRGNHIYGVHWHWWVGGLILLAATTVVVLALFLGFGADLRF